MPTSVTVFGIASLLAAASAFAQPALIFTGLGTGDMSSNGQGVGGLIFESDIDQNIAYRYVRGVGGTRVPGAEWEGSFVASGDLSVLAMESNNQSNWGNLNCFAGNTVPDLTNCPVRRILHVYEAGAWSNRQSWPRSQVTQTYTNGTFDVWVGGTRCDSSINPPNDISTDGTTVVGAGYLADALPNSNGSAPSGICRRFTAYSYDVAGQVFTALPKQNVANDTRADKVNANGTVIVGYDNGASPDPDGAGPLTAYTGRRLSVWRNGVQSLVDPYGSNDGAPVTANGNAVFSSISATQQTLLFPGLTGLNLVRWDWNGSGYTPTTLGRPVDWNDPSFGVVPLIRLSALHSSADGSIVYGSATYAQPGWVPSQFITRPIVWSTAINEGVPLDFLTYVASLLPPGSTLLDGLSITGVQSIDATGRVVAVGLTNVTNPCLSTFANGMLYLDGTSCEQPRINFQPVGGIYTTIPTSFGIVINVFASGSWPLQYQWQKETGPGQWTDLVDDNCLQFNANFFDVKGATGSQLRLGILSGEFAFAGNYRCVITAACGTISSATASIPGPTVCNDIDFNNDGSSFDPTDIDAFLSVFSEGDCIPAENVCDDIDFNNDTSFFDPCDIDSFLLVFSEGPCTPCGQ